MVLYTAAVYAKNGIGVEGSVGRKTLPYGWIGRRTRLKFRGVLLRQRHRRRPGSRRAERSIIVAAEPRFGAAKSGFAKLTDRVDAI